MAFLTGKEDTFLDDYEEGEILDEDNLFKNVSSSEEFSVEETDCDEKIQVALTEKSEQDVKDFDRRVRKVKHHRKKEHKCNEESICRLERSGKHCYARIRSGKFDSYAKCNKSIFTSAFSGDKENSRKHNIPKHIKKGQEKFKPCPALRTARPIPIPKSLYGNEYKGFQEKESRYGYRRGYRSPSDKYFNNSYKYQNKNKKNRRDSNAHALITKYLPPGGPTGSSSSASTEKRQNGTRDADGNSVKKSSLLKRLVGSGSTGLKSLTEEDKGRISVKNEQSPSKVDIDAGKISVDKEVTSNQEKVIPINSIVDSSSLISDAQENKFFQPAKSEPPKRIEVKWKRSIKDDKDELCLRVEALRSALFKKFTERRRKGLIGQKKSSNEVEDSLVDFVLGDDSDMDDIPSEDVESTHNAKDITPSNNEKASNEDNPNIISTDISGDVLKSEDMVIDTSDRNDTQVICDESAVKMEPGCNLGLQNPDCSNHSPLYFPPNFTFIHSFTKLDPAMNTYNVNQNANISNVESTVTCLGTNFASPLSAYTCKTAVVVGSQLNSSNFSNEVSVNTNLADSYICNSHLTKNSLDNTNVNSERLCFNNNPNLPNEEMIPLMLDKSCSTSACVTSEKKKKRKKKILGKIKRRRYSNANENRPNSIIKDTSNDLDEEKLREIALMSVKTKNKIQEKCSPDVREHNEKPPGSSSLTPIENKFVQTPNLNSHSEATNNPGFSVTRRDGNISEDDLDVDILRAQLLCSLGKQNNETNFYLSSEVDQKSKFTSSNILLNESNKVSERKRVYKLVRKKIKGITRKPWKQNYLSLIERRSKLKRNVNRGGNVFIKNDRTLQVQNNKTLKNVPAVPRVPKLVISVTSDTSDEEEVSNENQIPSKSDIEANIDLLLREAQLNSELEVIAKETERPEQHQETGRGREMESVTSEIPDGTLPSTLSKEEYAAQDGTLNPSISFSQIHREVETPKQNKVIPSDSSSSQSAATSTFSEAPETPQALKHLPAWQQEEYKMLKKKMAEKEKILELARAKLVKSVIEKEKNSLPANSTSFRDTEDVKVNVNVSDTESEKSNPGHLESYIEVKKNPEDISSQSQKENVSTDVSNISWIVDANGKKRRNDSEQIESNKKHCTNFNSESMMEDLKNLENRVAEYEKNRNEYVNLQEKVERLKKAIKFTESKISLKKMKLLQIKNKFGEEEKKLSAKMSSINVIAHSDLNKQSSREMEIAKLKFKEVSLSAELLFHNNKFSEDHNLKKIEFSTAPRKNSSPVKIQNSKLNLGGHMKLSQYGEKNVKVPVGSTKEISESLLKRNFSGKERDREEWDPNKPVCHFDLNGICRDEECNYQHFKTL